MKLEFELQRYHEVYKKNIEIGEKIFIILHRGYHSRKFTVKVKQVLLAPFTGTETHNQCTLREEIFAGINFR